VTSILALRLDRLGDLLMTLPSLLALRRAAPKARIELAVGSWNESVAKRLDFVDAVRVVDAPWAAWGAKASFLEARRALSRQDQHDRFDAVLEFQGDVRVLLLAAFTKAPIRAGYADTGGAYLLTHQGDWDESRSWYWQNLSLVRTLFPDAPEILNPYNFLKESDRERAEVMISAMGLNGDRPLVGIQPSAGRAVKEWGEARFTALVDAMSEHASVVLTGAESDRALVSRIQQRVRTEAKPKLVVGATLLELAAFIERCDVFVTGDTGPMHLSHSVGTKNVAIFGPSDPVRYGPEDGTAHRRVVRHPLYCSPCNMIRRPPNECVSGDGPECLSLVSVEAVRDAVLEALR
jgi:ADP-heptose:LPS heptosyltransferase